ncbi:glycoside hydrolase family 130 protein [Pseudonocardia sp. HH130630-07]|uniref:glycoside hydrolase family 130 protein n=1 Tax=Pseudonocardia sp. HH130630-07 TaxID=1690815 RepID=UPI0008150B04|nr:glycoside hydrolase family 130 protein [Pseudonocardia sp. HH130630-07]ANY05114.1 glycosidase [Pseudonocardia sp. HH130630-07]
MSPAVVRRHPGNPVLTASDVPYPADCVFNAGVAKIGTGSGAEYVMVFRDDHGYRGGADFAGSCLGLARSPDGVDWTVDPRPVLTVEQAREWWHDLADPRFGRSEIRRVYDPRITVIDDRIHLTAAVDTAHGILGAVLTTDDLARFELHGTTVPDNRNTVLFPERIDGAYHRLERPFASYGRADPESFDIWASRSPDLVHWGGARLVLGSEEVPYGGAKIGPAAPPIRTPQGWLAAVHVVGRSDRPLSAWGDQHWTKRYHAGLVLLDLDDPARVVGLAPEPLLSPREHYETTGFRGDVIFPCGMVAEPDGEVKIYYGAADTCVALAVAGLDDLLATIVPIGDPRWRAGAAARP